MTELRKDRENVEFADTMAWHQLCGYTVLATSLKELTDSFGKNMMWWSTLYSTRLLALS